MQHHVHRGALAQQTTLLLLLFASAGCWHAVVCQSGKNAEGLETVAALGLAGSSVGGGRPHKNTSLPGSRVGYLDIRDPLTTIDPDVSN